MSRVSSFLCAREGGGLTSLHLAVLYNNPGLVRLLLADPRTQPGLKAVQSEVPTTEQGEIRASNEASRRFHSHREDAY